MNDTLTALNGVRVGHSTHLDKLTGCTAVLFDTPYYVAYKGYGGSVGTYNTESLKSDKTAYKELGIFVAGGSMTGLTTGAEIINCLREDHKGTFTGGAYNPSISGAIVWDLGLKIAPFQQAYGRDAYNKATKDPVQNGNVGAGTGTSVGKFRYLEQGKYSGGMKAGVGNARVDLGNGVIVCAMTVLNSLGNIILPDGSILAGNRDVTKKFKLYDEVQEFVTQDGGNTTISIVGINVDLKSKQHLERVAHLASHGHVRAINPVHTFLDGDSIFVFSTDEIKKPLNSFGKHFQEVEDEYYFITDLLGNAAAKAVQESIYDACRQADSIDFTNAYHGVIPSTKDY